MDRARELEEKIYGPSREFGAIDLREEPYSGCCDSRPYFPKLYLSGKTDKGLMNLPTAGQAVVSYKVQRRHVDESRDDGVARYGADIEIHSIEHVEGSEDEESELSNTTFLREFAGERERDGAGRFAAGRVPSPEDFAVADAAAKKKRTRIATGAGLATGAVLGQRVARAVSKLAKP